MQVKNPAQFQQFTLLFAVPTERLIPINGNWNAKPELTQVKLYLTTVISRDDSQDEDLPTLKTELRLCFLGHF